MNAGDAEIARSVLVQRAKSLVYQPYYYGRTFSPPSEGGDCSGLVEVAWRAGAVYPWGKDRSYAQRYWSDLTRIPWDDRLPGDAICFGAGPLAHHIVLYVGNGRVVGANHGEPFEGFDPSKETHDAFTAREREYIDRMAAKGAQVVETDDTYWASARLGVVRAPAFL